MSRAFLTDMPQQMADADVVVCRAGATTLAELTAAGRVAILIPFPRPPTTTSVPTPGRSRPQERP